MHEDEEGFDYETQQAIKENSCLICDGDPVPGIFPRYCVDCFLKEAKALLKSDDSAELYKKAHWLVTQFLKIAQPEKIKAKQAEFEDFLIPKPVRHIPKHAMYEMIWHMVEREGDNYGPKHDKKVIKDILEFHDVYKDAK